VFPPLLGVANLLQLEAANRILAGEFTAHDDVLYSMKLQAAGGQSAVGSPPSAAAVGRGEEGRGVPGDADRRHRTADGLRLRSLPLAGPAPSCPACAGRYDYLDGLLGPEAARACAPDRVELELAAPLLSLPRAEALLAASGAFELKRNAWCLTAQTGGRRYTVFASGRLTLSGSDDPLELERFAATYLGV
jgi:hypothetical protein